jgi:hypothetical protein
MTFPTVQSVTRGNSNTNATSRNVTLPATINANDVLIALFANDGDATVTWDNTTAGTWTLLFSTASGVAARLTAYWKVADGTEDGAVLSIDTSAIERSAWHIYRISGAQSVEAGTAATGTSTAPNSPSLTPSWGSADTTWLTVFASDNQTADPTDGPTNYTTNDIYDDAPNAAGVGVGSSYRDNAASSEDPAAWTIAASLAWVANTIAVRPDGGATDATASPGIDTLVLTGQAPTVSASSTVSPGIQALTLTGFAPTVSTDTSIEVQPGAGSLALTGFAATVSATQSPTVEPGFGALVITGYAPRVSVGGASQDFRNVLDGRSEKYWLERKQKEKERREKREADRLEALEAELRELEAETAKPKKAAKKPVEAPAIVEAPVEAAIKQPPRAKFKRLEPETTELTKAKAAALEAATMAEASQAAWQRRYREAAIMLLLAA